MADYKRMVSYMYQYENGVKKKNVGYVRVEAKSGECKITLHMQLPGLLDSIFPIYMIQRKKGDMELVYIGDAILKNQTMDSKLSAMETNIMDSGHNLSDMGGILLFLNDTVFYATEWDDKPVILSEVLEALKPKDQEIGQKEVPSEESKEDVKSEEAKVVEAFQTAKEEEVFIPLYKLPGGYKSIELKHLKEEKAPANPWETVERMRKLMGERMDGAPSSESETATNEEPVQEENSRRPLHNVGLIGDNENIEETLIPQDNILMPQTEYEHEERQDRTDTASGRNVEDRMEEAEKAESPLATRIFESYPRIYPFEDNEITMCVKIEPKDIGYLPVGAWVFSNNSFLLHGYYCYNHLILAKIKERNGFRYILGVPGIYHNRERFMARMFGFDCFKSIRKRELRQGDFGYWYVPVSI